MLADRPACQSFLIQHGKTPPHHTDDKKTEACVSEMALLLSAALKADILYLHMCKNLKVMFKGHYFASLVNKTLLLDIGEHERNQSFMLPESTIQV